MSRRHTSTVTTTFRRTLGAALAMVVAASALLPVATVAQNDTITARDIQYEWQLLTMRDDRGVMEDVPAGVGATMQLRSGAAFGEAACSSYDSSYNQASDRLDVFVADEEIVWRDCDETSRAFDEQFYRNLSEIAFILDADDVLSVRDVVGEPLMNFTRAKIENDPTVSRWNLARIGDADGAVAPVIAGLSPWIEFLVGGSVVGDTGCGAFLGKYDTNEGRIDITDVHYRLSTCTDGARSQAEKILRTLGDISDFQVRPAGLALEDENGIIRLALEPDLDVASSLWTPTAIFGASGRQQRGQGNELTTSAVKFLARNYQGRSICRNFKGFALRSGLAVNIGQVTFIQDERVKPAKACPGTLPDGSRKQDIEADFITALENTASYALRGDELTLYDVDGARRAVLEPQPPLTGTTWAVFNMRVGKKLAKPATDGVPITATFEELEANTFDQVFGSTGVLNGAGENTYFGTFKRPGATSIQDMSLSTDGKGCNSKANQKKAPCKSEERFLRLLSQADTYVVRGQDLKFYDDNVNTINLRPLRLSEAGE